CTVADTTLRRLRGLIGRRELNPGDGIVLRPGWSIHTAFVLFPIDVAFVDADQVVVKVVENLKPFRASVCRGARDVVELAAGDAERPKPTTGLPIREKWEALETLSDDIRRSYASATN